MIPCTFQRFCPVVYVMFRSEDIRHQIFALILLRLQRYTSHVLTYLLTYLSLEVVEKLSKCKFFDTQFLGRYHFNFSTADC